MLQRNAPPARCAHLLAATQHLHALAPGSKSCLHEDRRPPAHALATSLKQINRHCLCMRWGLQYSICLLHVHGWMILHL